MGDIVIHSFFDGDRSARVRWTCSELGLEWEDVRLEFGAHRSAEFRLRNPFGRVPAVELNGRPMFESCAICWSLAERSGGRLLVTAENSARCDFLSWVFAAASTIESALFSAFVQFQSNDGALEDDCRAEAMQVLSAIERQLENRQFVVGEAFSLADILVACPLTWVQSILDLGPHTQRYLAEMKERPATQKARTFA